MSDVFFLTFFEMNLYEKVRFVFTGIRPVKPEKRQELFDHLIKLTEQ